MSERVVMDTSQIPCRCEPSVDEGFQYRKTVPLEVKSRFQVEQTVRPSNGLTGTPYEIVLEEQDNFVVANSITMHAKLKLVKADGSLPSDDDPPAAPVNNTLASLWECIKTRINDHEINPEGAFHVPVKSIMANLLSYNPTSAQQLREAGFSVEAEGEHTTGYSENYKTQKLRCEQYAGGREVSLAGALPLDICSLDSHLAPGTRLTFEFYPADDQYVVLAAAQPSAEAVAERHTMVMPGADQDEASPAAAREEAAGAGGDAEPVAVVAPVASRPVVWRVQITDLYLQYRRVSLAPAMTQKVITLGDQRAQRYVAPYTEVRTFEVPQGVSRWVVPVFPAGHALPKQIVVGQTPTRCLSDQALNPLVFPHMGLHYIAPRIDDQIPVNSAVEVDFDKHLTAYPFYRLFQHTGKANSTSEGTLITRHNFENNYSLFPFDFTPDRCNGRHMHGGSRAKLDLVMEWKSPLTKSVTVFVYAIFDQVISIHPATKKPSTQIF